MIQKNQSKFNWRNTLGALAVGLVSWGCLDASTTAAPIRDNFELAQVGIRTRVQSPVPLNLKPRFQTSFPSGSYSNYRHNSHRRYNSHHRSHHSHYPHQNRRRRRGKVIIISPGGIYGSYGSDRHQGGYYNRGSYHRRPHRSHRRSHGSYIQIGF